MNQSGLANGSYHPTMSSFRMGSDEAVRQEHLDDLIEQSSEFGVELEIEDHVDHLWLGFIRRTCARRGAGVLVMQDLIEISEEWGIPIRCAVATDAEALIDWYLAMGFGIETMADVEGGRPLHAILFRSPECAPMRAGSFQLQEA